MLKKTLFLGIAASFALSSCSVTGSGTTSQSPLTLSPNFSSYSTNNVKSKSVEITWNQKADIATLDENKFDIYGINNKTKTVRARISPQQETFLTEKGLKFKAYTESGMDRAGGLLPGYKTYQQMKDYLLKLQTQYPDLVTVKDVGDTFLKVNEPSTSKNNDIWMISITNKKKTGIKPTSLFISGMHARELAPVEINLKLIDELVTKYGKDATITNYLDTRQVDVVPIVNVDGRIMVENGNTWQRENAHGVDLNRDFDCQYLPNFPPEKQIAKASSSQEPETQAVQNLYKTTKYTLFMDIHSYGDMMFWPVGYSTKDIPEAASFKKTFADTFKKVGYQGGTSAQILYETVGTSDDYAYIKNHTYGLGMEVGQSFRPSFDEVNKMWDKIKPSFLYLVKISDAPYNNK